MSEHRAAQVLEAADRIAGLAEEVESSSDVSVEDADLERARAALHKWVDALKGVVVNAGLGRVTIIHENGRVSTISSPDLPFAMTAPLNTPGA